MEIDETQDPWGFRRNWTKANVDEVERRFKVKLDRRRNYIIDGDCLYYRAPSKQLRVSVGPPLRRLPDQATWQTAAGPQIYSQSYETSSD